MDISPTAAQKPRIAQSFDRVARRYDLLCALNPGYRAHLKKSALRLGPRAPGRVLDLCCGTGLSTAALLESWPQAEVVGMDASAGMLEYARRKPELARARFLQGDAMDPRASGLEGRFDGILMAYGIRNVPDPDTCLARLRELLAPGGVLCLHEYSVADSRKSRWVWNAVTCTIVIPLALLVTRSTSLFRYLRRSVNEFDGARALQDRLRRAGYAKVRSEPMDGWQRGVVHSFLGEAPEA
jgi:ubiquinone/menaquinone biosynthesis C-methylase UbiE